MLCCVKVVCSEGEIELLAQGSQDTSVRINSSLVLLGLSFSCCSATYEMCVIHVDIQAGI